MLLTQKNIKKYQKSDKKGKSEIINNYAFQCNVPRNTIVQRLKRASRNPKPISLNTEKHLNKCGRKKKYLELHKLFIKEVWKLSGNICAERIFPELRNYIKALEVQLGKAYPSYAISDCKKISLGQLKLIIKGFPKVHFLGNISRQEYVSAVQHAHVGLALKLPSSDLADTTFPSKVIELASVGLLVLSTRVSDVPILFKDDGAIYLDSEEPSKLASSLLWVLENRMLAAQIANKGQSYIMQTCGQEGVGRSLRVFLFPDSVSV